MRSPSTGLIASVLGRAAPGLAGAAFAACAAVLAACGDPITVLGDKPNTMRIVAGVPDQGGKTAQAKATESLFDQPAGVVVDADGFLYLADSQNRRVVKVASNGDMTIVKDDGFCTGTCMLRPTGLALDPSGRLLVTDPGGNRIWRIDLASGQAVVVAGTGDQETAADGLEANGSPIASPLGVAAGPDGTVYFAESAADRVRSISPGGVLGPLAGTGERSFSGDGGPAAQATVDFPTGVALGNGVLYFVDAGNNRIRVVDLASGVISTIAGNGARGFAGDGGPATDAMLDVPESIGVTPGGDRLYMADTRSHRVRVVNLEAGTIQTFAGTGETGFSGDLRDAGATALFLPRGVATSAFGLLFISDTGHHITWRVPTDF